MIGELGKVMLVREGVGQESEVMHVQNRKKLL